MNVALFFALLATASGVELNATGSCPCYYGGKLHHCNHAPFKGDTRCVCGPKASDWKTQAQCKGPAKESCPCYYGGKWHHCNHAPFKGDTRCVCGPKASDWKTQAQCKGPVGAEPPNVEVDGSPQADVAFNTSGVEVNATGSCPCYYGGKWHHCNHAPFKGDTRCVCGPKASDWKTKAQCKGPAKESCPCYYGGKWHHCNHAPFKGDTRCVCGPKASDWKTQAQCKGPAGAEPPNVEVDGSPQADVALNTANVFLV